MGGAGELLALLPEASVLAGAQVAIFGPCLAATRVWWPSHKDHWTLADTITSTVLYPLLLWHAFRGVMELRHDVESRWFGLTDTARQFQVFYVTRSTLHMGVLCMQRLKRSELCLMIFHHCITVFALTSGLVLRNCHYWACLNGCCEVTNIFLNNVWLFKEVTIKGLTLQDHLPRLYIANGVLLWLSYVVFRLLLFSYWLYTWHSDTIIWTELTWARISNYERYFYASVTVALLVLSIAWFVRITKGLVKAVVASPSASCKARSE